jgi:glycine reductase
VHRIVQGKAITHPLGDPSLGPERERQLRRRLVALALEALATPVKGPTVFRLGQSDGGAA